MVDNTLTYITSANGVECVALQDSRPIIWAPTLKSEILADWIAGTSQMSILRDLPLSLCEAGPEDVDGIGNYHLQVLAPAPSQRSLSTLYFLDSHGQVPGESQDYEHITQSQIDWFVQNSQSQRTGRGKNDNHMSLAFIHIPVPEFRDRHLKIHSGHRGEPTECPGFNSHFYDALAREGILALGCGHDHVNDFCGLLPRQRRQYDETPPTRPGPWLCYGGCSGFRAYCSYGKVRFHRRIRVWELDTTNGTLKTWIRVEYGTERVDELVLAENGVVVDTCGDEVRADAT